MITLSEVEDTIQAKVKCCACGGSLKDSKFVNGVSLNKLATWKSPVWKNILVVDKYPEPRALAIFCDTCIEERRSPQYAVEWNNKCTDVKYHKVGDLKDLPEIKEEDIQEAEASLYDFGKG